MQNPESGIANEAFFEAVAQLVPIIFLVLVIQYRDTGAHWQAVFAWLPRWATALGAVVATMLLALTEFAALDVLWRQEDASRMDGIILEVGLGFSAIALLVPALGKPMLVLKQQSEALFLTAFAAVIAVAVLATLYYLPAIGLR